MPLDSAQKNKFLQEATAVYRAFLALDFFKSSQWAFNGEKSLACFCQNAITNGEFYAQTITLAEQACTFNITPNAGRWQLSLIPQISTPQPDSLKPPQAYNAADIASLFFDHTFILEHSAGELFCALLWPDGTEIGGFGKENLYRSHLTTLHAIIEKMNFSGDMSHFLAALPTGSGKTYLQALLLYVLHRSGFNAIFALPDKLLKQFEEDWQKFLPDACFKKIKFLGQTNAAQYLPDLDIPGQLVAVSSELLLDDWNYYRAVCDASPQTFLCFDEQHLLMQEERRCLRLRSLSKDFPSLFLTATPDSETYRLSGSKLVVPMLNSQKIGQPSTLVIHPAKSITDIHRTFSTLLWKEKLQRSVMLQFSEAIQPETPSAAATIIRDLPFIHYRKPNEALRWSLQVPMARKILCIADDNESVVNFCHALQHTDASHEIYHKGNLVNRHTVSRFLNLPNLDEIILKEDYTRKCNGSSQQLSAQEQAILLPLRQKSLADQLQDNIFHYLVEYVLADAIGIENSSMELDKLRYNNTLCALVSQSVGDNRVLRNTAYFTQKLQHKIDAAGAETFANLLADIRQYLESIIGKAFLLETFVDNDFLKNEGYDALCQDQASFKEKYKSIAKKYMIMGLMSGMEDKETPIRDAQPFLGLEKTLRPIYAVDGTFAADGKKRRRNAVEILDEKSQEAHFKPIYMAVTEAIADGYFRLGFVGIYLSNKKTEGFSDNDVHTVINITENFADANNAPEALQQGFGRNRGRNERILPIYIHALGRQQKPSFDLAALEKADYYPDLLAAQDLYHQRTTTKVGEDMGRGIIAWFYAHRAADGSVDPQALEHHVFVLIAEALRQLNTKNRHDIDRSRAQLIPVIAEARRIVNQEIAEFQNPYPLTFNVQVMGSMTNFIYECYYMFGRMHANYQLYWHTSSYEHKVADTAYKRIITTTHFKQLVAYKLIALEVKHAMSKQYPLVTDALKKHAYPYLTAEAKEDFDKLSLEHIIPLLVALAVDAQKTLLHNTFTMMPSAEFADFLQSNVANIKALLQQNQPPRDAVLKLLHQIPALRELGEEDLRELSIMEWLYKPVMAYIKKNAALKTALSDYLRTDFLSHLGAFVVHADYQRVTGFLDNKASLLLDAILDNPHECSQNSIFPQYQELSTLQTLEQRMLALPGKITNWPLQEIAELIHKKILPCLVNWYPLNVRQDILDEASLDEILKLLNAEKNNLPSLMATKNPENIAEYFFGKIYKKALPSQIDINEETGNSLLFFEEKIKGDGNLTQLGYFILWVWDQGYAIIKPLLVEENFYNAIAVALPYDQWKDLCLTLKNSTNEQRENLAKLWASKIKEKQKNMELNDLLPDIHTVFSKSYQGTETQLNEAFALLQGVLQAHLAPILKEDGLPLLAAFIQDDAKKAQFLSRDYDQQTLCAPFFKDPAIFAKLADDNQQIATVLVLLNSLGNVIFVEDDLKSPMMHVSDVIKEIQHIGEATVKKSVLDDKKIDRTQLAELMTIHFAPIVFHPEFANMINVYLGALTLEDIVQIYQAVGIAEPENAALRLQSLRAILKTQNREHLKHEMMTASPSADIQKLESYPLGMVLREFAQLAQEVMDCQCYYNQHSHIGDAWDSQYEPKLFPLLSEDLQNIWIKNSGSSSDKTARKIFFMQGMGNGLHRAGRFAAYNNASDIATLQAIDRRILVRLQSGIHSAQSSYWQWFYNIGLSIVNVLWSMWQYFCVLLCCGFRWTQDTSRADDAVHRFTQKVNDLKPLTQEEVAKPDCKTDTVKGLEHEISGFFRPKSPGSSQGIFLTTGPSLQ